LGQPARRVIRVGLAAYCLDVGDGTPRHWRGVPSAAAMQMWPWLATPCVSRSSRKLDGSLSLSLSQCLAHLMLASRFMAGDLPEIIRHFKHPCCLHWEQQGSRNQIREDSLAWKEGLSLTKIGARVRAKARRVPIVG
jgi:hypothetical protein